MTICIGRPIIEILAKEGAWSSSEGHGDAVAADDLFQNNPYDEIERLRAMIEEMATCCVVNGDGNDYCFCNRAIQQKQENT